MADDHVYGEVNYAEDLRNVFEALRRDVAQAPTREELTRLYRRAEYLVTLTYSPAWQEKFGPEVEELRQMTEAEFMATARALNQRAAEIGTEPVYDEVWGKR